MRLFVLFELRRPAKTTQYHPETFRRLLDRLGIDGNKEEEVYECGPEGSLRVYGGWFYFAGALIGLGERMTLWYSKFSASHHFVDAKRLPKPKGNFGETAVAVVPVTRLPGMISRVTALAICCKPALAVAVPSISLIDPGTGGFERYGLI